MAEDITDVERDAWAEIQRRENEDRERERQLELEEDELFGGFDRRSAIGSTRMAKAATVNTNPKQGGGLYITKLLDKPLLAVAVAAKKIAEIAYIKLMVLCGHDETQIKSDSPDFVAFCAACVNAAVMYGRVMTHSILGDDPGYHLFHDAIIRDKAQDRQGQESGGGKGKKKKKKKESTDDDPPPDPRNRMGGILTVKGVGWDGKKTDVLDHTVVDLGRVDVNYKVNISWGISGVCDVISRAVLLNVAGLMKNFEILGGNTTLKGKMSTGQELVDDLGMIGSELAESEDNEYIPRTFGFSLKPPSSNERGFVSSQFLGERTNFGGSRMKDEYRDVDTLISGIANTCKRRNHDIVFEQRSEWFPMSKGYHNPAILTKISMDIAYACIPIYTVTVIIKRDTDVHQPYSKLIFEIRPTVGYKNIMVEHYFFVGGDPANPPLSNLPANLKDIRPSLRFEGMIDACNFQHEGDAEDKSVKHGDINHYWTWISPSDTGGSKRWDEARLIDAHCRTSKHFWQSSHNFGQMIPVNTREAAAVNSDESRGYVFQLNNHSIVASCIKMGAEVGGTMTTFYVTHYTVFHWHNELISRLEAGKRARGVDLRVGAGAAIMERQFFWMDKVSEQYKEMMKALEETTFPKSQIDRIALYLKKSEREDWYTFKSPCPAGSKWYIPWLHSEFGWDWDAENYSEEQLKADKFHTLAVIGVRKEDEEDTVLVDSIRKAMDMRRRYITKLIISSSFQYEVKKWQEGENKIKFPTLMNYLAERMTADRSPVDPLYGLVISFCRRYKTKDMLQIKWNEMWKTELESIGEAFKPNITISIYPNVKEEDKAAYREQVRQFAAEAASLRIAKKQERLNAETKFNMLKRQVEQEAEQKRKEIEQMRSEQAAGRGRGRGQPGGGAWGKPA